MTTENRRHVYKALLLVDYLLRNGSEQVIRDCRNNVVQIQTLTEFQHIDENDKDVGLSVRERAKVIVELLHDEKRLRGEREKAQNTAKKFQVSMGSDTPSWNHDSHTSNGDNFEGHDNIEEHPSNRTREDSSEEEEDQANSRVSSRPTSVSDRSTNADARRPRIPSFDSQTTPPVAPPAKNLFDLDDVQPAPASTNRDRAAEFDFFNNPTTPAPSSITQNIQPFSQSFFSGTPTFPNPSDFSFDPRGISPGQGLIQSTPSSQSSQTQVWADFTGAETTSDTPSSAQVANAEAKQPDPWDHGAHLFDLNLANRPPTSTQSISKTPMGSMAGAPMGKSGTGTGQGMGMGMGMGKGMATSVMPKSPATVSLAPQSIPQGINNVPNSAANMGFRPGYGMQSSIPTLTTPTTSGVQQYPQFGTNQFSNPQFGQFQSAQMKNW